MAKNIIDINEIKIKKFVESRRPKDLSIRAQLDYGYSYDEKITEIYAIRPIWNDPSKIQNHSFAKIRFYKSEKSWKLYWMRASGKWELYEPCPESHYLDQIIEVISEDVHACFFG